MFDGLSARPSYRLKSGCVAQLCCCVITLCFQLFQTLWVIVKAKNSIRNAPASAVPTKSRVEAITYTPQIVTYTARNGAQRSTKVSFSKPWLQALELLQVSIKLVLGWYFVARNLKPSWSLHAVLSSFSIVIF